MKIFKIMYDNIVVGIVANQDGTLQPLAALEAWNKAQPSYQGDSAEQAVFIEV